MKKHKLKKNRYPSFAYLILAMLCCLFLSGYAIAAVPDSTFDFHYTISNGLPTNNVYKCIKDRAGYMWFATEKGVVRYDGYSFKVFNTTDGLPGDDVYNLAEDNQGRIWVYTLTSHFGYIKNGQYFDLKFPIKSSNIIYPSDIMLLPKGIIVRVPIEKISYYFYVEEEVKAWISTAMRGNVRMYDLNASLDEFIVTKNYDMYNRTLLQPGMQMVKKFKISKRILPELEKKGLYTVFGNCTYLVNTRAFYRFNLQNGNVDSLDIAGLDGKKDEFIYVNHINPKVYQFITNRNAVKVDIPNFKILSKEPIQELIANYSQVAHTFQSTPERKWYCTNRSGIIEKVTLPHIINKQQYPSQLDHTVLVGRFDGKFSYWWDDRKYILYRFSDKGDISQSEWKGLGKLHHVTKWDDSTVSLSFNNYSCLWNIYTNRKKTLFDHPELIEMADLTVDSVRFNLTKLRPVNTNSPHYWVNMKRLVKCADDKIIGFNSMGIYLFNLKADSVYIQKLVDDRFANMTFAKPYGIYLFYNNQKISIIKPSTGEFRTLDLTTLKVPDITSLAQMRADSFGNVYLLLSNSILLYNPQQGIISNVYEHFDLRNAKIFIHKNNFIIAGRFGFAVARILGKGKLSAFRFTPDVKDHTYNQITELWVKDDGEIMARTDLGWINAQTERILAEGRVVDNNSSGMFTLALNEPFKKQASCSDTLIFSQREDKMVFNAINYYGKGQVHYAYKSANHVEWSQSSSGEILLNDFEPGVYTTLYIKMYDDLWKSRTLSLTIYRMPYWYQTPIWKTALWTATAIILVLAGLGIISIARYRVTITAEKKRQLTDLELRAIHAQINPHFIFNTLSSALYFIQKKDFDNAYSHVSKFSHLLRSYLKSSQQRYVTISEDVEMLKRYIELQQTRFEDRFDYHIQIGNRVPASNIQIPSLLLQPLVENAINHGLFHKRERGMLSIRFDQGADSTELICDIEDNGVGRQTSAEIKKASANNRESYGSRLTDRLMDIFRQYENMNITINYIDKELPETGTIVRLVIKNVKYIA